MVSPHEIDIRRVLVGHRAAVNVVDFDQRYIVSASGDRTIKVILIYNFRINIKNLHRFGMPALVNSFAH